MATNNTKVTFKTESNIQVNSTTTESTTKGRLTFTEDKIHLGLGNGKKISYEPKQYNINIDASNFDTPSYEELEQYVEMEDNYPVPGSLGFGVGIAPEELVKAENLIPLEGYDNPASENYGNYMDITGSIMVWIPKYYVKKTYEPSQLTPSWTTFEDISDEAEEQRQYPLTKPPYWGRKVEMSRIQKEGFTLPLCFMNANKELDGIFLDKYLNTVKNKKPVSLRFQTPTTMNPTINGINQIKNTENLTLTNIVCFLAAKQRNGNNYCIPHSSLNSFLYDMALCHLQTLYEKYNRDLFQIPKILCAYASRGNHFIAGCAGYNTTFNFIWDPEITFMSDDYQSTCLTASCEDKFFANICHNGQKCGVTDVTGSIYQIENGVFFRGVTTLFILKESIDIRSITNTNFLTLANYNQIAYPTQLSNSPNTTNVYHNTNNYKINYSTGKTNHTRLSQEWIFNDLNLPYMNNLENDLLGLTNLLGVTTYSKSTEYTISKRGGNLIDSPLAVFDTRGGKFKVVNTVSTSSLANSTSFQHRSVGFRLCLIPN